MSLILCSEECIHQVNGFCRLIAPALVCSDNGSCIHKTMQLPSEPDYYLNDDIFYDYKD